MYFLRCNNCGHFNAVKSEYLTFCSRCNKKLDNNFLGWKKQHPEKTFEAYKQLVCIPGSMIQPLEVKPARKGTRWKYGLSFVVAFIVLYVLGQYGCRWVAGMLTSEAVSEQELSSGWERSVYPDYEFALETPGQLVRKNVSLPENKNQVIEQIAVSQCASSSGVVIVVNCFKYKTASVSADLEGVAGGFIQEMKSRSGMAGLDYHQELKGRDGIPGFIQKGTYRIDARKYEFLNVGFVEKRMAVQVCVAYLSGDIKGKRAANRVIESIEMTSQNH